MLIFSMSVWVDGFIADREGGFGWRCALPKVVFSRTLDRVRSPKRSH